MKKSKIIFQVILFSFFLIFISIKFLNKKEIIFDCNKISKIEKIKKRLTKPHLRTIDVVEIELTEKTIHIQSNDKELIQDIFNEVYNCEDTFSIHYFNKKKLENIETFFVGSFFF